MGHKRKLVIGGIALTEARIPVKLAGPAMERTRDDLEKEMIESIAIRIR